jgi:cytidylate kinase
MSKITIAIDGHSSCGKSTMARQLAADLGYIYIDSGAMYRAVTLAAQRAGLIDADKHIDEAGLRALLPSVVITFAPDASGRLQTYLNGACVEAEIRTMAVSSCVSPIAALGFVRERLVALQQELGREGGIVMDGRDVGTVVFPHAELKVFVTASARVRAERRLAELRSKGDAETTFESVLQNVEQRDYIDSHRAVGPLRQAEDARLLDNSDLTIAQQYDILMQWAQEAIARS